MPKHETEVVKAEAEMERRVELGTAALHKALTCIVTEALLPNGPEVVKAGQNLLVDAERIKAAVVKAALGVLFESGFAIDPATGEKVQCHELDPHGEYHWTEAYQRIIAAEEAQGEGEHRE